MPMSRRSSSRSPVLAWLVVAALIATGLTWILAARLNVPAVIGYLLAINLITLLYYGLDKRAAKSERRRVPERTLHFLAVAGGSPAALLGQRLFKHKTIKRSFRTWFWIIVAVQALAIAWWVYFVVRGPQ